MTKRLLLAGIVALTCACGGQDDAATPVANQPDAKKNNEADVAAKKKAAAERAAANAKKREALKQKQAELTAFVKTQRTTLAELDKKHAAELKALPDARELRPYVIRLTRDSNTATAKANTMERQLDELKKAVEGSSLTGELKALKVKEKEAEGRYWKAHSGWQAALEDKRFGKVESPVRRDLAILRSVRTQWLQATPAARRGPMPANQKKIVNDGFRAWVGEMPERKKVVTEVLKSAPDSFDFTALDFFLLVSNHELSLEKQNVVLEKKEMDKNAVEVMAIEKELDGVREKIAAALTAGGGDLEQYQDLSSRIKAQQQKADDMKRQVEEYAAVFEQIDATKARHEKEAEEATKALEDAEKELRTIRAQLRK